MRLFIHPHISIFTCIVLIAGHIGIGYATADTPPSPTLLEKRLELADSLHNAGRTDSALVVGKETIKLAQEEKNEIRLVAAYSAQGVYLRSTGEIEEALDHYNKALEIVTSPTFREAESPDAIDEIATLYINLSVLNLDMQHKEEAVKNSSRAREWIEKSKDSSFRAMAYGAAGGVMMSAGEFEKAKEYQKEAYKDALASGNKESAFRAAAYTMLLSDKTGDGKEVISQRELCQRLLPEVEATMSRLLYYQAECSIALNQQQPREAINWFDKILELPGIENMPFVELDCYNNMHRAYSVIGDYKNAYQTLLKGNELRDSIWEKQKAESLRDLTVKYETKETELALARSEANKRSMLNWILGLIVIIALSVIGFIYYSFRQKRNRLRKEKEFADLKAETARRLTSEYLEGLEAERRRMAGELHDGVCNDLLAIKMAMQRDEATQLTVTLIDNCREAVRRVSHELLPPEFNYDTLDEVIRYFVISQNRATDEKLSISYLSDLKEGALDSLADDEALDIYRIVQEAVGNAIKYSGATEIDVSLKGTEEKIDIIISDNGIFHKNNKKGVGLESIKRRVEKLKGEVTILTEKPGKENSGTIIKVLLPRKN